KILKYLHRTKPIVRYVQIFSLKKEGRTFSVTSCDRAPFLIYIKDRKVPAQKKPLLTKRLSSALSREKHEPQYTLANYLQTVHERYRSAKL
ncbi:MAG: hypothetical protein KH897_18880, partial [Bacteroides sp.]|uniref:hypothetical protein n=1 Tax=Bacteroides sp. TaxID=29523 RepID=UPI0025C19F29